MSPPFLRKLAWSILIGFVAVLPDGIAAVPTKIETDNAYLHRIWQFEDGLPQNSVQAVCQTQDGYLWVGTQKGLARFDGTRFTTFDQSNVPEIKHNSITSLCETRDGSLWIATEGGLNRLLDGKFFYYSKTDGLASDTVRGLYETKDGVLWITTALGVNIYKDGKFSLFAPPNWPPQRSARSFYEDRHGNFWLIGEGVHGWRDGKITSITSASTHGALPVDATRSMCEDEEGAYWIGGMMGLTRMSGTNFTTFTQKHGYADSIVNLFFRDRENNLWLGTYGGLNRITDGTLYTELTFEGRSLDVVNSMCQDREGNIWVGTKDGLNRLKPRRFIAYTKQEGLGHNNVISVLESKTGSVWIGTWGGGLQEMRDGKIVRTFSRDTTLNAKTKAAGGDAVIADLVLGLHETRDNTLWFALDYDGGIYSLKTNWLKHYTPLEGFIDPAPRVILEDRAGDIWIGTRTALNVFHDGKFTRYTTNEGLAGNLIRVLLEDHEGTLWIGTTEGLTARKDGKFKSFTTSDGLSATNIASLFEDADHVLWIGTTGGGLNRYKNGKFTAYTTQRGLFRDDVLEIVEDDFGNFWMTCRFGVFRVRKKDFDDLDRGAIKSVSSISYNKHDGLTSIECSGIAKPSGCKTKDGRIWFATAKGLVVVDPKLNLRINETPPPVVIEEVIADKKNIESAAANPATRHSSLVTLPPGRGEMEFHYAALSFSEPSKNRFKYMLEGFDKDWVDAGSRREAYYSKLSPGQYRFRVKACNNDGVWNEAGAVFAFYLAPHFYQAVWFYLACTGGITLLGFGMYRFRIRQLQAQQEALEKLVAERTKDLQRANQQLVETSRKAGMAEVASGVLHNVGNVLNSVNVSATLVMDAIRNSRVSNLKKAAAMMREHSENLGEFLKTDEKGKQLPSYLGKLGEHLSEEQATLLKELSGLCKNVDHIKDIVAMQQNYAKVSGVVETINVVELIEDALRMNAAALTRHDIHVVRDYVVNPIVCVEKHKVLQILVNLIRNAKYACDESHRHDKQLTLSTRMAGNCVKICVIDNGIGIPPENLTKIFSHGFTTRKTGHGFGLHSGAIAAKDLGGSLTAHSDGPDRGATFVLEIPIPTQTTKTEPAYGT